jgi:hypothetical protein
MPALVIQNLLGGDLVLGEVNVKAPRRAMPGGIRPGNPRGHL